MESSEFGRMVRRSRDRVAPEAVGVSAGRRRRAAGLRREELAALAGISADYLTRLEQGRATAPSVQVVEALAQALRLPDPEREVLYRLAGHAMPGPDLVPSRLTPSVQRLLDRLSHTPVVVYDATWTLLTANAPYDALMGETSHLQGLERNAIWRNLHGLNRTVHTAREQADHEARLVADLRLTSSRYPADQSLRRLVRDLADDSPRFAGLWDAGDTPPPPADLSKQKVVEHPSVGRIALDCDTLIVAGDDLRVMAYTAEPGTADAERLALAIVVGTQSLVE
ncbi:transcriptional regulator with XRE-family HTH domain [Catenulispora sp. GAS73]|uniref:helix-turn-helix transcriptional regulator n=1 Tax=Catenulispora sp. GAS73 TaxID=3156269 RepID=UPI003513A316